MKPYFKLHAQENVSMAIVRLHKYIRSIKRDYAPMSACAARVASKKAFKPKLRIVK